MILLNRRQALVLLVFVVLGFLIYSNTLDVPFHFDDESNIVENPNIRLTGFSLKDITGACFNLKMAYEKIKDRTKGPGKIVFSMLKYFIYTDERPPNIKIHLAVK